MIITIRTGEALLIPTSTNVLYDCHVLNLVPKKERERIIRWDLEYGKGVIHKTFINEIVEEIIMIADEMGLLDQIELVRYDKTDSKINHMAKEVHYTGQELYNALIKHGLAVL